MPVYPRGVAGLLGESYGHRHCGHRGYLTHWVKVGGSDIVARGGYLAHWVKVVGTDIVARGGVG
jgi:hypothetical protein